jgi:hypothetical protein
MWPTRKNNEHNSIRFFQVKISIVTINNADFFLHQNKIIFQKNHSNKGQFFEVSINTMF